MCARVNGIFVRDFETMKSGHLRCVGLLPSANLILPYVDICPRNVTSDVTLI
jgi:hypothetical protein